MTASSSSRPVMIWIYIGVFMLLIQVILGGITRLTGSGLSITEWDVAAGAIPPLNAAQWQDAFEKYKHTPQFRLVNSGFSLSDFKFIFFWEWFHRLWARMVGVVFLVGFGWLLLKNKIRRSFVKPLIILFLLGALQGVIGWIMVASGLVGDAIYVAPTKLALHFIFALILIVYTFWVGLQLSVPDSAKLPAPALRRWTIAILIILVFQLTYGALMAGHKAANVASTWPDINGDYFPPGMFRGSWLEAAVGNRITVQFIHRTLAYLLFILVVCWTVSAVRIPAVPDRLRFLRWLPLLLIGVQIVLGICSLLASPWIEAGHWVGFDWLALFHQITGLLFLMTIVGILYLLMAVKRSRTV
jgi:cytochrome c oxidase assembly protein subunit 15